MGFLVFFRVRNVAATRGQYLALSKAWWSCSYYDSLRIFRASARLGRPTARRTCSRRVLDVTMATQNAVSIETAQLYTVDIVHEWETQRNIGLDSI